MIDVKSRCKNSIGPELMRNTHFIEKCASHVENVTMFPFSHTILSRGVRTRCLPKDVHRDKFGGIICSKYFGTPRILSGYFLKELAYCGKDLSTILEEIHQGNLRIIIDEHHIIEKTKKRWGMRWSLNIAMNKIKLFGTWN